jgi:hypothetical protein
MSDILIHFKRYDKVVVNSHSSDVWEPNPDLRKRIDGLWEERVKSKPHGPSRPMIRVAEARKDGRTLYLNTQMTGFKEHRGTIDLMEWGDRANGLAVSANLITSDGKLVLGKRGGNVWKGEGQYIIASGGADPEEDFVDGLPDLESALRREGCEEFYFPESSYTNITPFVVFGTAKEPAPSFSYVVQLGLSSKEIGELFRKGVAEEGKGAENIEIKFLENDPEKISKEMESNGRLYRPWVKALMEHYAFSLKEG